MKPSLLQRLKTLAMIVPLLLICLASQTNQAALADDQATVRHLSITLIYMASWLFLLYLAARIGSKGCLLYYNLFWLVQVVFFCVNYIFYLQGVFIIERAPVLSLLFFYLPLAGWRLLFAYFSIYFLIPPVLLWLLGLGVAWRAWPKRRAAASACR